MAQVMPADTGGNMFTRRYGPLPGWAWILITFAIVYVFLKWRSRKQAPTTTTGTGTGTGTGTSNALSSNLVGVQEPVPTLAGTYTVSVQPAQSLYSSTTPNSTQGVATPTPSSGSLFGTKTTTANANNTANVQPQTLTSSPQTQQTVSSPTG